LSKQQLAVLNDKVPQFGMASAALETGLMKDFSR
jgi:hypothetical protein